LGRSGFTIIELLAVVAIIGTLIGLLLPAVQRTRESGRQTQCSNNQKNIGLAITNYQPAERLFPAGNEQVTGRFHAWSSGLFADGHVASLHDRTDGRVLIAICTKSGGETESLGQ